MKNLKPFFLGLTLSITAILIYSFTSAAPTSGSFPKAGQTYSGYNRSNGTIKFKVLEVTSGGYFKAEILEAKYMKPGTVYFNQNFFGYIKNQ